MAGHAFVAEAESMPTMGDQGALKIWAADKEQVWVRAEKTGDTVALADGTPAPEPKTKKQKGKGAGTGGGAVHVQNAALAAARLAAGGEGLADMSDLDHLHEPAVLENLDLRHAAGRVYTWCGDICVAVNPYTYDLVWEGGG
eukprot:SAG22_NODE_4556_length_1236_cov_1.437995_2_plen_141_part_01